MLSITQAPEGPGVEWVGGAEAQGWEVAGGWSGEAWETQGQGQLACSSESGQ